MVLPVLRPSVYLALTTKPLRLSRFRLTGALWCAGLALALAVVAATAAPPPSSAAAAAAAARRTRFVANISCSLSPRGEMSHERRSGQGAPLLGQPQYFHRLLAHLDLADLAGDGHRELVGDVHVPRNLIMGELTGAEITQ